MSMNEVNEKPREMRVMNLSGSLPNAAYTAQIWLLPRAIYVWINDAIQNTELVSLSTAIMTAYDPVPLVTTLIGATNFTEAQVAQRLAKRTNMQCFVSCNLTDNKPECIACAEKDIITLLKKETIV